MKGVVVILSFLVAVNALTVEEQWENFKSEFGRTYKNSEEESIRFEIFQENLRKIEAHNKKYESGDSTYAMGITQFSDLTEGEIHKMFTTPEYKRPENVEMFEAKEVLEAAAAVDWREKGAVLEVLDQGGCGSCYAFSAMGALEGQRAIKHNIREQLSEQEVVDCSQKYGNEGCGGGMMDWTWNYIKDNGIATTKGYKYEGFQLTCKNNLITRADVKVKGTKYIANNTEAFRQAVEVIGPISISFNADPIVHYSKGIFDTSDCVHNANHGILIVGYGSENGTDYWIVKNSWGKKWGENGYFRVRRYAESVCGIYDQGMFPVIE